MSKLIEELCSDEKLVFADCVSGDLSDSRNMSAGVAQCLRKGLENLKTWSGTVKKLN